jgi:DNA-binding LytR/AlgR family response regulator
VLILEDVLYMESSGAYTLFTMKDSTKYTASKMLKVYIEALQNHPDFARIHRGHIVNKNYVKAVLRQKHKIFALMEDDKQLEVSPGLREGIYTILGR